MWDCFIWNRNYFEETSQQTFACSKATIETLEKTKVCSKLTIKASESRH